MISALVLLAAAQTVSLHPTDDIWVYHFAADQTSDPYLRCWGADGMSAADPNVGDAGSWSVMKFDLSKLPSGKLTSAELNLHFVPNPNIDEELGKKFPIEVRSVTTKFEEENYANDQGESIRPKAGKETLLASAPVIMYSNAEGSAKITIKFSVADGNFMTALKAAQNSTSKELAFALTSALTPDEAGESMIYKFFSTNSEEKTKPTLSLKFE